MESQEGRGDDPADKANLRAELGSLKLKALKMRAAEVGVAAEAIADADDADDVDAHGVGVPSYTSLHSLLHHQTVGCLAWHMIDDQTCQARS